MWPFHSLTGLLQWGCPKFMSTEKDSEGDMEGLGLLRVLVEATGLPPEAVGRELGKIIATRGLAPESLTLEDVREVLGIYLQDVLSEAKESAS